MTDTCQTCHRPVPEHVNGVVCVAMKITMSRMVQFYSSPAAWCALVTLRDAGDVGCAGSIRTNRKLLVVRTNTAMRLVRFGLAKRTPMSGIPSYNHGRSAVWRYHITANGFVVLDFLEDYPVLRRTWVPSWVVRGEDRPVRDV